MKTFVIAGHCVNNKKTQITKKFIQKIRDSFKNSKIMYVDHLPCPRELSDIVDFSLHVKYNPILNFDLTTDITERFHVPYWGVYDHKNIIKTVPNHSFAHHDSLYQAFQFLYNNDLGEIIHFLNYDCNEDTFESIELNHQILKDNKAKAVFFPYRYDPEEGVCTEFFSISKYALENMFLHLKDFGSYENRNIVRDTDYNVEYTYFSHLNYRNIKYHLHDMWPTRDGEIGNSNFQDINETDEIIVKYNNPNNKILSVIPIIGYKDDYKLRVFVMRFGNQMAEHFNFSFLDANKNAVGQCNYSLKTNDFMYVDPVENSKYVSIKFKEFRMTFDLLDIRNYGKIV